MFNCLSSSFFILFCFFVVGCSNSPKAVDLILSDTDQSAVDARLLPFSLENPNLSGNVFKVAIPCLDMQKMDYFAITILGKSGYTHANLKKTNTEIYKDEEGNIGSKLVAEYQSKEELEPLGEVLVFLQGIVHPSNFGAITFTENASLNKKDWISKTPQKPLARTLRGDKKQMDQCYHYQWKQEAKTAKTTLHLKQEIDGKCETHPTEISLTKMTAKQFKDFNLLVGPQSQILYRKDQLVFVSQGEYSEAAATPLYSFETNNRTNYIVSIGVKRSNSYGLLVVEGDKIWLQLYPYC